MKNPGSEPLGDMMNPQSAVSFSNVEEAKELEPVKKASKLRVKAPVALVREKASVQSLILVFAKKGTEYDIADEKAEGWVPVMLPGERIGWIISENVEIIE